MESFIPLWEWDLPKKKSKKRKGEKAEKGDKKSASPSTNGGGALIEEMDDAAPGVVEVDERPSRNVKVEEVDDEDA